MIHIFVQDELNISMIHYGCYWIETLGQKMEWMDWMDDGAKTSHIFLESQCSLISFLFSLVI